MPRTRSDGQSATRSCLSVLLRRYGLRFVQRSWGEWQVFFGVCDRLLDQLKPFDELIGNAEKQLEHLSLLELIAYLSVLAYQAFAEDAPMIAPASSGRSTTALS